MSFGKSIIAMIRKGGYKTVEIYHKWPTRTDESIQPMEREKFYFIRTSISEFLFHLNQRRYFFLQKKLKRKHVPFVQGRLIFGKALVPETARSSSRGVVSVG